MTIGNSPDELDSLDVVEPTQKRVAVAWGKNIQRRQQDGNQAASPPIFSPTHDLSVVVPTRNEHDNIWPLLESLHHALRGLRVEVIFVDDSDDDTPEVIENAARTMNSSLFHIHLVHRLAGDARAGGLATAVVDGMNRAQAEYVAVIDADLQHPPEQLRVFYDQAVAQNVDLVLASRYIKGGSYQGLAGVGRRCISIGLKWTAKLLFPEQLLRISDPLGGFFLLRRSLLADVSLRPIGYKILLELLLRCQWRQVLEVPYHFQERAHGQSKANMRQGILTLQHMQRLWREVPAAGRVWKISILLLLNVLIALILFTVNKSFPWVWTNLNMIVFGGGACLDFVLLKRFILPSPNVTRKSAPSKSSLMSSEERETVEPLFNEELEIVEPSSSAAIETVEPSSSEDMETIEPPSTIALSDGPHLDVSSAQEGQDNTLVAPTPSEKTLVAQSITSSQAPRPVVRRRRRLLSIASIVLLVVLILVSVRVNTILSASNDELLVRIGDQQASTVDLRQAFPISPYLLGANVFPAVGTQSQDHARSGFMNYGPRVYNGLRDARIKLLRFRTFAWPTGHGSFP